MKRIISLTLIVLFAVAALAGCTNNAEVSAPDGQKVAGRAAGNDAVYYSFNYPDDWDIAENDGIVAIRKDLNKSDLIAQYASINVLTFGLSDVNTGARDYWKQYKKDLSDNLLDFKMLGQTEEGENAKDGEETKLGDTVALKVRYSGRYSEKTYLYDQVICCRNGTVYIVTLTAVNDDYDSVKDVLDTVTGSFVFHE